MSNTIISPNMNLPVPVVDTDPGPDWATNINACMSAIDSHNHTTGQGVQITPAGININTDLPLNANNLTTARSVRFSPQSSALSLSTDIGCLYEVNADLYYNDAAGNQVRITQGGSVTGSSGTITGLPSGTASASFSGGTFTFAAATNTPATMNVGPLIIGTSTVSPKTVTLTPSNSQGSNYSLVFPTALPGSTSFINVDVSGNMSTVASTGSGSVVLATSPVMTTPTITSATLVTPALGTPTSGNLANCTGFPASGITGTLPIANGGTNSATALNSNRFMISSSGAIVEASAVTASRVVVSDSNGLPTALAAITPSRVVVSDGSGLPTALAAITASRVIVSDGSGFPTAATTSTTQIQYLSSATGTTGTTSTNIVFSTGAALTTPTITSATLVTPALGTPTSGNLANCTSYPAATTSSAGTITAEGNGTTSSTFSMNGGGGTSGSVSISYARSGKIVSLYVPTATATTAPANASTTFTSNTAIPSDYRPSVTQTTLCYVQDGSNQKVTGSIQINSSGIITIASQSSVFSSSVTSGIAASVTITYNIT